MQRNSQTLTWRPKGLSDVLDASAAFPGAMASLQNLIPDPSTPELFQCRPASILLTSFGGFTTPGFISVMLTVGNLIFGMISTGRNAGNDEPFCFNLQTNTFITVGGTITNLTTPTSPSTTGDWTPPEMAVIGSKVVVTHLGFNGVASAAGNFFGWFDILNPTAPVWHAGNFTGPAGLTFTTAPQSVAQFNGRAYYIVNVPAQPAVIFSDINNAIQNTGAVTPVLTFGDNLILTTLAGLPLNTTQLGGIIQSMMVFKGVSGIFQITGDSAQGTLAVNSLNVQTGTFAANTVVPTPKGLAFIAPDGLRIIDFNARISDPIGLDGQGVNTPFQLVVHPSRMNMACNVTILRVSLFNGNVPGAPAQEYWYDFARKIFTGPHTFPANQIVPSSNTFIVAPLGVTAKLFQSDVIQSLTSTFVENGQQLTFACNTAYLPDLEQMVNHCMTESTLLVQLIAGVPPVQVSLINWSGTVLDTVQLSNTSSATLWGGFLWGGALWGGVTQALANLELQWHQPIVFDRIQAQITGQSGSGFKVGVLKGLYQQLRTQTNIQALVA